MEGYGYNPGVRKGIRLEAQKTVESRPSFPILPHRHLDPLQGKVRTRRKVLPRITTAMSTDRKSTQRIRRNTSRRLGRNGTEIGVVLNCPFNPGGRGRYSNRWLKSALEGILSTLLLGFRIVKFPPGMLALPKNSITLLVSSAASPLTRHRFLRSQFKSCEGRMTCDT